MTSKSYWCVQFFNDIVMIYVISIATILIMMGYGYDLSSSYLVLLLFPLGVVPFTYVFSYLFSSSSVALIMVFVLHLTAILLISTLIFVIRVAVPYEVFGDRLNLAMRLIPSYSIA